MKYSIALVCMLSMLATAYADDSKDFTKESTEVFPVREGALLNLENKYGTVSLETWDRPEMEVHLTIKVKASSESKAEEIFDMIDVSMSSDDDEVEIATVFDTDYNDGGWWDKLFGDSYEGKYEVNYDVKLPSHSRLMLTNKYGHIHIKDDMIGKATIVNKYGNIYTQNIAGDVRIDLGYGDAKLGAVQGLDLEVKYSKVYVAEANDAKMLTKYSSIKAGQLSSLHSTSKYDNYTIESAEAVINEGKYDDFNIGTVGSLSIDSKYTDVDVNVLNKSMIIDGKYATATVHKTTASLERIAIEGKYTHISLSVEHPFSLVFEGEYVKPRLPSGFDTVERIEEDDDISLRGHMGGRGGAKISADMAYGSFKIRN